MILALFVFAAYTVLTAIISAIAVCLMVIKYRKIERLPTLYPINVSIDRLFSINEKQRIIESLIWWQEATHGLVTFHIVNTDSHKLIYNDSSGYAVNFIRATSKDKEVKGWDKKFKTTTLGMAQRYTPCGLAFIVVDRFNDAETFTSACGHEMGHLLGLNHAPNRGALMYKGINKLKPTEHDMRQLISFWRTWMKS
ncbi:hypothetical protein LCGC14_0427230 [marine sediment metagenome]|uniref:Peptidase M10 metallopeptidase domain-containing protein n=1 Tax=marine sediment metagenome TaxID=412755 RepID=A0A0F9VBB4_9ZZZZ